MTQNDQIKKHLSSGKSITSLQALRLFKCMRLAARISDCKKSGMQIETEIVKQGKKRFAKYFVKRLDN